MEFRMTPSQIHLVQTALPFIVAEKEQVARLFYSRLFQLDPALRDLFKDDLTKQGQKVVTMLGTLIAGLNRPEQIVPILSALGQRHAGYGVQDSHYATVGAALLWTLERCLGPTFSADMRDAWIALYFVVSRTMIAGARAGATMRKAS
jgi:hemoglobin-like flavoprotein